MKRNVILLTMMFAAGSLLADPKDDVTSAIKSLSDGANFSWSQNVEVPDGQFGGGTSEGKVADGMVYGSRTFGDMTFETIVKGTNFAMNRGDGWQTAAEMAAAADANGGGGGGFGGGRGGGNFFARFAGTTAASTMTDMLTNVGDIKLDGDAYTADLTDEGAKTAASGFRGRRGGGGGGGGGGGFTPPEVTDAKGSVKFWIKDGKVTKFVVHATGKSTDRDGNPTDLDRTTTIEIKDVGTTKISLPDDVTKKISG